MLAAAGRVVMVSGANRGIGRAVAERLLAEGYSVSLGARRPATLAALADGPAGDRALAHGYEAQERDSATAWVAATLARFGRLDGLVNNAGIFHDFAVPDGEEAALDAMWAVNVKGPLRLIQAAYPHLRESGAGRIVTIASLSGLRVKSPGSGGYAMTKFAAVALAQAARLAGWEDGIRSSAICPGFVATDMTAGAAGAPSPEAMTDPASIARLVAMLIALPNTASVALLPVNCLLEPSW